MATKQRLAQALCVTALLSLPLMAFCDDAGIQRELDLIKEQNRVLQDQVKNLTDKVAALEDKDGASGPSTNYSAKTNQTTFPKIRLGMQGGLGWEISNLDHNANFFVEDVKLSVSTDLTKNCSFYSDVNLNFQQSDSYYGGFAYFLNPSFNGYAYRYHNNVELNEIYVYFHNLLEHWSPGNLLNVRAGQFYIPFGEDYELRYPFENPLIQRTLTDIWGLAPGVELYGSAGKWSWQIAAQNRTDANGSIEDADKSVAGRIRFTPSDKLSLSASAMRTGNLQPGEVSSLNFMGGGLFGPPSDFEFFNGLTEYYEKVTGSTHSELFQLEPRYNWKSGYVRAYGGVVISGADWKTSPPFELNTTTSEIWYYNCELVQDIAEKFYVAGRAGQVFMSDFDALRLSIGFGYRFNKYVLAKTDYTYDQGNFDSGWSVHRDIYGAEVAFRF